MDRKKKSTIIARVVQPRWKKNSKFLKLFEFFRLKTVTLTFGPHFAFRVAPRLVVPPVLHEKRVHLHALDFPRSHESKRHHVSWKVRRRRRKKISHYCTFRSFVPGLKKKMMAPFRVPHQTTRRRRLSPAGFSPADTPPSA